MKKWLKNMKKDQRGLTLVELLAVVVILAIVAAIAFVLIGNVIDNSRKDSHVSNAQQLIAAAKLYEASGSEIPSGGVTAKQLKDGKFLGALTDPWTKKEYTNLQQGTNGKVTKDQNGVYTVQLTASNSKCNINHTEEQLIEDGRKVCEQSSTTP